MVLNQIRERSLQTGDTVSEMTEGEVASVAKPAAEGPGCVIVVKVYFSFFKHSGAELTAVRAGTGWRRQATFYPLFSEHRGVYLSARFSLRQDCLAIGGIVGAHPLSVLLSVALSVTRVVLCPLLWRHPLVRRFALLKNPLSVSQVVIPLAIGVVSAHDSSLHVFFFTSTLARLAIT